MRSGSATCAPVVITGLSEVIGSWKIIEISAPRTRCISRSGRASRSRPRKSTWPPAMRPGGSRTRRRIDSAVTDLPLPLSPTTPSVPPARIAKLTPSTARNSPPPSVAKRVTSSRTSSSGAPAGSLISRSSSLSTRRRRSRRRAGSPACTDRTRPLWLRARRRGSCRSTAAAPPGPRRAPARRCGWRRARRSAAALRRCARATRTTAPHSHAYS